MKGLKLILESLGIKIDPNEVQVAFERAKLAIPALAKAFDEMTAKLGNIETRLEVVENLLLCCTNKLMENRETLATIAARLEHDQRQLLRVIGQVHVLLADRQPKGEPEYENDVPQVHAPGPFFCWCGQIHNAGQNEFVSQGLATANCTACGATCTATKTVDNAETIEIVCHHCKEERRRNAG